MRKFVKAFAERSISEPIFDAKLSLDGIELASGIGLLRFNSLINRFVLSFFATEPADVLDVEFFKASLEQKDYEILGLAKEGLSFKANVIGYQDSIIEKTKYRNISFLLRYAELSLPASYSESVEEPPRVIAHVQRVRSKIWEYSSHRTTHSLGDFHFDGRYDALKVLHRDSEIQVRKGTELYSTIEILNLEDKSVEEISEIYRSALDALSFCAGDDLNTICSYIRTRKSKIVRLYPGIALNPRLARPLPLISADPVNLRCSRFTAKTMEFFRHSDRHKLRQLLKLIVDSEHMGFGGQELACGTAIEGISNYILNEHLLQINEKLHDKNLRLQKEFERDLKKSRRFLRASCEENMDKANLERITSHMRGKVPRLSAKDRIRLAAEIIGVDLTDEEATRWGDMRNPANHGELNHERDIRNREISWMMCLALFQNLFVKLVGWNEPIINWSGELGNKDEFIKSNDTSNRVLQDGEFLNKLENQEP